MNNRMHARLVSSRIEGARWAKKTGRIEVSYENGSGGRRQPGTESDSLNRSGGGRAMQGAGGRMRPGGPRAAPPPPLTLAAASASPARRGGGCRERRLFSFFFFNFQAGEIKQK